VKTSSFWAAGCGFADRFAQLAEAAPLPFIEEGRSIVEAGSGRDQKIARKTSDNQYAHLSKKNRLRSVCRNGRALASNLSRQAAKKHCARFLYQR
jgi:hypothetical protein